MKTEKIVVKNITCNGCANAIKRNLEKINGIKKIEIDLTTHSLNISYENIERDFITNTLIAIGYPEVIN